jgi:hypothetical protein
MSSLCSPIITAKNATASGTLQVWRVPLFASFPQMSVLPGTHYMHDYPYARVIESLEIYPIFYKMSIAFAEAASVLRAVG